MDSTLRKRILELVARIERARDADDPDEQRCYDDAILLARGLLDDPDAHPTYSPLTRYVHDSLPWRDDVLAAFERVQKAIRAHRERRVPLERLTLEPMASGAHCLVLTERVPWEDFPAYAETVARVLRADVEDRADSPVERVWSITLRGGRYWLAYDDTSGVSLEGRSPESGDELRKVRNALRAWRDG